MNNLLFIDDEDEILKSYKRIFEKSSKSSDLKGLAADFFGEAVASYDLDNDGAEYVAYTASQGLDGVELVKKQLELNDPFKVAFIDMRMPPGINGLETAKRIRKLDPKIEIVIVTAYSDIDFKNIVKELGSPDKLLYLKKPFDSEEIKQFALNLVVKHKNECIKDDFISNVSHELKTPLASIIGFHQLLSEMPEIKNQEAKEYLNLIGYSSKLMKGLIEELLTSVEFKRSGIVLEKKMTKMVEFAQNCYRSIAPIFKEKDGVNFDLKYDEAIANSTCNIDQMRINQCINNLISNAAKFTSSGEVNINLSTDESFFFINISDTGLGIPEEKMNFIFEKFARVENEHHEVPGLGLGLSIVKSIMDAHNAKIIVKSEDGKGSCFILKFKMEDE
jgi:signal transduction histidine kinase